MIKTFCDFCDQEIAAGFIRSHSDIERGGVKFRVTVDADLMESAGRLAHVCHGCLWKHIGQRHFNVQQLSPVSAPDPEVFDNARRERLIAEIAQGLDAHKSGNASDCGLIDNLYRWFDSQEYSQVTRLAPLADDFREVVGNNREPGEDDDIPF